jgi:hypothetical protein
VQQAFAGELSGVDHMLSELHSIATMPDVPPITPSVLCGITGGSGRGELRTLLGNRIGDADDIIVNVSPAFLLHAGLPYARSRVAVVTDTTLSDVPERYRDRDRAERLVSVIADGVEPGGLLVAPANAWELQDYARRDNCAVAVFSGANDITRKDKKVAVSAAWVDGNDIIIEQRGRQVAREPLASEPSPHLQAAAAILHHELQRGR